jgi:hypothetical protein
LFYLQRFKRLVEHFQMTLKELGKYLEGVISLHLALPTLLFIS